MQGEVDTAEKEKLEAKIEELVQNLDEKNNLRALLNTQLKQLQVCHKVYQVLVLLSLSNTRSGINTPLHRYPVTLRPLVLNQKLKTHPVFRHNRSEVERFLSLMGEISGTVS